jgi:hypothetical protein
VSGLTPATTYFYRAFGSDTSRETSQGATQSFTTLALPRLGLANVSQSRRRWREGSKLPVIARARSPVGTTFRFTLNASARVRFVFRQRGRKRGALSLSVGPGAHRVRFAGRISRHKKLTPGRYTLIITATNAAGQRATAKLTFTIVRGKR